MIMVSVSECSGVVGCSADGTCANFKSYPVSATNRISSSLIQMPDSVNEVAKMVEVSSRTIIQDNKCTSFRVVVMISLLVTFPTWHSDVLILHKHIIID
jgi:hypothetical protein